MDAAKMKVQFFVCIICFVGICNSWSISEESMIKHGVDFGENFVNNIFNKPATVSQELDCKIKKLAFEMAQQYNVGRGSVSELKSIYDGLELGSICNETFQFKFMTDINTFATNTFLNIYVDGTNGKANHLGDHYFPLADIQSGIDACVRVRTDSSVPCTVHVREGIYTITKPLLIEYSNIYLVNYKKESVIVTSDVLVSPDWEFYKYSLEVYHGFNPIFEKLEPKYSTDSVIYVGVTNEDACRLSCEVYSDCSSFVHFDNTTKGYSSQCYMRTDGMWNTYQMAGVTAGKKLTVYSANLASYKLKTVDQVFVDNRRAVRARFPNANPETQGLHTNPTGYVQKADFWSPPRKFPPAAEIKLSDPSRVISLFSGFSIGIDGTVSQFVPPESYWGVSNPQGGGGATYQIPTGLKYSETLEIALRSWKNPKSGIVHGFHSGHWGNWMFKLDGRNEDNNTFSWSYGGFQEARGSSSGKEWYVENIFEELDEANEWYFDDDDQVLYFAPNQTTDLPAKLSLPQLDSLLRIVGASDEPVVNTSVIGVTFLHSTQTFLKGYAVPSGGDWSVHANAMVYIEGTEQVNVSLCVFDSPGGNGLFIHGFNRNTTISHNHMYRLGDNGIVLVGDNKLIDGTHGNQPRGTRVLNNLIHENGVWGKQTYAFVQSVSCDSHISANVFFNGPRAGININDGFGGGNIIERNLLFNFVRETDDHGDINTWDRVPYLTRMYDGVDVSLKVKENQVTRNFLVNNYRSVWPIDHDDGSSYWTDTYNYLVYGGSKNYLGHDMHSRNNVYIYPKGGHCAMSEGQILGKCGYGDLYANNKCISSQQAIYRLGNCNVAHLNQTIPYFHDNSYYTPNATVIVTCGSNTWNLTQFQSRGMELGTSLQVLATDDDVIEWGRNLLGL